MLDLESKSSVKIPVEDTGDVLGIIVPHRTGVSYYYNFDGVKQEKKRVEGYYFPHNYWGWLELIGQYYEKLEGGIHDPMHDLALAKETNERIQEERKEFPSYPLLDLEQLENTSLKWIHVCIPFQDIGVGPFFVYPHPEKFVVAGGSIEYFERARKAWAGFEG
ncbi:MAG: hypothetical protein NPIRA05_01280 [Nitrospirales bacterium]|nr:MAG: hypothetical protein NPIRA05_01280 [Nitrospirales bacterium]